MKKQNKLSTWFYNQTYFDRLAMVIVLFLIYIALSGITLVLGILAGIEYITPILLVFFFLSFILFIGRFSRYFFIPFILSGMIVFLGSYELGEPCRYYLKTLSYNCDCNGLEQYKLFGQSCIGERENCTIKGEEVSCEEIR